MIKLRFFAALATLAVGLTLVTAVVPVQAQDDDVDSLAGIAETLRRFGEWWGTVASADVEASSMEASRTEDGGFVRGNPDAPVTIVEFSDFACPHCQRYQPIMDEFVAAYVETGMARHEFRLFPTAGGQVTAFAGVAAECVDEQQSGAFWQAHGLLYEYAESGNYDSTIPAQLADDIGLDEETLWGCMETVEQVFRDIELGREVGVNGTPAVLVRYDGEEPQFIELDGRTYNAGGVPFEVLSQVVEEANAE